jgi:hypothetical protein
MMNKEDQYIEASRLNERTHRFISAALVSLMMASAGLTVAQFGHQMVPYWNGGYLAVIGFLIALERFYSHRMLKKLSIFTREWIVLISTQWVVNFIVIKLIVTLSKGWDVLLDEIPLWQRSFGESFFTSDFLIAIIFAFSVWILVGIITELLDEMGLDAALIAREVMVSVGQEQAPPRQRLMATVFAVGGVLMFLTAAARVDTRALFANESGVLRQLSPLEGGGGGTLLYFLLVFVLLSQARYITLNTRWFLQGVPVSRSIAANWAIYSIGFLILLALIVSVLPTSYSLGLLSVLGYLIDIIMGLIILIFGLILTIVGLLAALPFLLFGLDKPANLPTYMVRPPVETPPPPMITESTPLPWLDLLKSILFWSVFLTVIGYSIAQYLRQHEEILDGLRKIPGWKIVAALWHWISGLFGGLNRRFAGVIEAGRTRLRSQRDSAYARGFSRFTSLRRLSPRQKVLFYYHALLRRGDETGLPRKRSQTPEEYSAVLERSLPTVENEITSLTDAFSEARYSRHLIEPDDANHVRTYWEQIRRVFRGRRG